MGVKFNWGRALSSAGNSLSDYYGQKMEEERRQRQLESDRAEWQRRYTQQLADRRTLRDEGLAYEQAQWEDRNPLVNTGMTMPFSNSPIQARVPQSALVKMMFKEPAPAPITYGEFGPVGNGLQGQLGSDNKYYNLRDIPSDGGPQTRGTSHASPPTQTHVNQLLGLTGSVKPTETGTTTRVRRDVIGPGELYTPSMTSDGRAFEPFGIRDKFAQAAMDSMSPYAADGSARVPRDPRDVSLAGEIAEDISLFDLSSAEDSALPVYDDIRASWLDKVEGNGWSYNEGMFENPNWLKSLSGGVFGSIDKYNEGEFVKKGRPGYEAFKDVVVPYMRGVKEGGGLSGDAIVALREHAKNRGIDFTAMLDDINELTDAEKKVAEEELSSGLDLTFKAELPGGKIIVVLPDGREKVLE
jgi:hypothetical protein